MPIAPVNGYSNAVTSPPFPGVTASNFAHLPKRLRQRFLNMMHNLTKKLFRCARRHFACGFQLLDVLMCSREKSWSNMTMVEKNALKQLSEDILRQPTHIRCIVPAIISLPSS